MTQSAIVLVNPCDSFGIHQHMFMVMRSRWCTLNGSTRDKVTCTGNGAWSWEMCILIPNIVCAVWVIYRLKLVSPSFMTNPDAWLSSGLVDKVLAIWAECLCRRREDRRSNSLPVRRLQDFKIWGETSWKGWKFSCTWYSSNCIAVATGRYYSSRRTWHSSLRNGRIVWRARGIRRCRDVGGLLVRI